MFAIHLPYIYPNNFKNNYDHLGYLSLVQKIPIMKTIKFTAYLLYRYYLNGRSKNVAYIRTIGTLVILSIFHIIQILLILNKFDSLEPGGTEKVNVQLLKIFVGLIPIALLLIFLVREPELKQMKFSEKKIKNGYLLFIVYGIVSFSFTFILAKIRYGS